VRLDGRSGAHPASFTGEGEKQGQACRTKVLDLAEMAAERLLVRIRTDPTPPA